jgi:hypothetical protein
MQLLRGSTPEAMLDHGDYADFGIAILRGAGPPAQARRVGSVTCRRSVTPRRSFLR